MEGIAQLLRRAGAAPLSSLNTDGLEFPPALSYHGRALDLTFLTGECHLDLLVITRAALRRGRHAS
jgi:hypothetical protein